MGNTALTQIDKLLHMSDPQLSFKWVSPLLPLGLESHFLESIDIPFNNIKVNDSVYGGSGYTYFPGSHDVSAFNASFYMDSLGTSLKWITAWKSLIKDFNTGAYGLPSRYKQKWLVQLLNTKNDVVLGVDLQGVWPSETSAFNLNYTDNGRLVLTQSFSIDNAEVKFVL